MKQISDNSRMLDKKIIRLYQIGGSKNVKRQSYSLREILMVPKH
jgi:hypothetical protein